MQLISRAILFILSLSLSIFLGTIVVHGIPDYPFYWEKIDVDLQLFESGDLLVTETQKYVFLDRYTNQRNRYIKIDKIDDIQDVVVTENNRPVSNLKVSKSDGEQHISWEHEFTNKFPESQTFVLKYRAIGSLDVNESQSNFKWMAIFPDRKVPVKSAQVILHLPAKLAECTKNFTTNGVAVDLKSIDSTTLQFTAKESIEPQAKLAVLGQFPTNALNVNKSQWQSSKGSNWWGWVWGILLLLWIFSSILSGNFYISVGGRCGGDGGDGGGGCGGCGGGG
jgi:Predicted membrane protein (DUF2207)